MKYYLYKFEGRCSIVSAQYADEFCKDKPDFIGNHNECVKYAEDNNLSIIEDFL